MATNRQKVLALAEELGASVDIDNSGRTFTVNVVSPAGKGWACDGPGLHNLVGWTYRGENAAIKVWRDLRERMEYGVCDCNPDCDCFLTEIEE